MRPLQQHEQRWNDADRPGQMNGADQGDGISARRQHHPADQRQREHQRMEQEMRTRLAAPGARPKRRR